MSPAKRRAPQRARTSGRKRTGTVSEGEVRETVETQSSSEEEVVDDSDQENPRRAQLEESEAESEPEVPEPHPMPYIEVPPLRTRPISPEQPITKKSSTPSHVEKREQRQRTRAEDRELALTVLREIFDKPQQLSLADLLKLSPKTRALANELIRSRKLSMSQDRTLSLQEAVLLMLEEANRELGLGEESMTKDLLHLLETVSQKIEPQVGTSPLVEVLLQDLDIPAHYRAAGEGEIPAGALICPDPVEQFLISNSGAEVKGDIVAASTDKIRVFYPVINHAREEESILDNGSQVCSASEEVAKALGISWDPEMRIGLQSSNRSTATTLGLARNVPIYCGNDVVAYVQLHIVANAAYKVLLGRPFMSAMSAISVNSPDGTEILTLRDPNNHKSISIPTYPRGMVPEHLKDIVKIPFRTSRS